MWVAVAGRKPNCPTCSSNRVTSELGFNLELTVTDQNTLQNKVVTHTLQVNNSIQIQSETCRRIQA